MAKKDETKLKTLRLKSNLIDELEKLAVKDNRNFNNFVETILMREASRRQTA
jgi:hypothetical protein